MDPIAEWTAAYERVRDLVADVDDRQAEQRVPACPGWTVRELLAHMIGLDADILADDHPDDHNEAWTQRQVDARQGRTVADLLDEWSTLAEPLREWMAANNSRPLGDIVIHEQDLRGAVGVSGGRDTGGLGAIRDRMADAFAQRVKDLPPIALEGDGWTWCSSGEVMDADVVLRADDFELSRALMTRRSADQLRSWTTRGDVGPYLDAFAGLGPLPTTDLSE